MVSKKLLKTVTIGIATIKEIKYELKYQIFIFLYNILPLYCLVLIKQKGVNLKDYEHLLLEEDYLFPKMFSMCGTSASLISDNFLLFILLLIFLHSKRHGSQALEELL